MSEGTPTATVIGHEARQPPAASRHATKATQSRSSARAPLALTRTEERTADLIHARADRAAEALLAQARGPGTSVRAAQSIWDRSHVVRLHLAMGAPPATEIRWPVA